MTQENFITGANEEEIWQQLVEQFQSNPDPLDYTAVIKHENRQIILDIDIDLGGGFESGYETTSLTSPVYIAEEFRFAIHREHFIDEVGKFFGMEDVQIGYEEFDKKLIIKTNNADKVKKVFADATLRALLQNLEDFTLSMTTHRAPTSSSDTARLELLIEEGITDLYRLRPIYRAFYNILDAVEQVMN